MSKKYETKKILFSFYLLTNLAWVHEHPCLIFPTLFQPVALYHMSLKLVRVLSREGYQLMAHEASRLVGLDLGVFLYDVGGVGHGHVEPLVAVLALVLDALAVLGVHVPEQCLLTDQGDPANLTHARTTAYWVYFPILSPGSWFLSSFLVFPHLW